MKTKKASPCRRLPRRHARLILPNDFLVVYIRHASEQLPCVVRSTLLHRCVRCTV